jgi:hypothetical protein
MVCTIMMMMMMMMRRWKKILRVPTRGLRGGMWCFPLPASQGPGHNMRTYQAYDINGYRFYTEERDRSSKYQNSGVTMLPYADDEATVKERFFGRIEENWELDYAGEKVSMFHVRWAKSV